jgi:flagellar basal-body rod modification protein FlgD
MPQAVFPGISCAPHAQNHAPPRLPHPNFYRLTIPLPKGSDMTTASVAANASPNKIQSKNFQLKTEDFIKMMVTQLQNQDPMEPAKNQELLAQMSQIGQLQSTTSLQDSLKTLVLQNNLGAAGNLIGKMIQGMDENGDTLDGMVTSVRVQDEQIYLELDSGKSVPLGRVTSITAPTA